MNHIGWVDYGKVIGIYLVVLAHTSLFIPLEIGIYTFHMPLFFFISGYLFSFDRNPLYKNFVKKRFKQLIIPYIWINIITYIFWLIIGRNFGDDNGDKIQWYTPLINIFLGNGNLLIHNIPIWFLMCLFVVENLFYLLFKKLNRIWIGLIIFVIVGFFNYTFNPYLLPFCFNTAIVAMVFYIFGNAIKKSNIYKKPDMLHLAIGIICVVLISHINGKVAMHKNFYNNYFIFLFGGIVGITFIVNLCLYLSWWFGERNWIKYIAKNTLIICGFHLMTFTFIKGIMVYIFDIPLTILEQKIEINILFSVVSILLCIPIIFIINKYFPFMIGKRKFVDKFKI